MTLHPRSGELGLAILSFLVNSPRILLVCTSVVVPVYKMCKIRFVLLETLLYILILVVEREKENRERHTMGVRRTACLRGIPVKWRPLSRGPHV